MHLNFPFRKPLEPLPVPTDRTDVEAGRADSRPYTTLLRGITMPSLRIIETDAMNAFASGLTRERYAVTVTRGSM